MFCKLSKNQISANFLNLATPGNVGDGGASTESVFQEELLRGVCAGVCVLLLLLPCEAGAPTALFIFGDSLSDPGNNNYINTLARANTPPNGIDYPGGFATGRFTNGRTVVDITGKLYINSKLATHIISV